jgi:hypothetical protein
MIKLKRMRQAGPVGHTNANKNLIGKTEGKISLETYNRKLEDNIKKDLREIGLEVVGWINLAQDRNRWPSVMKTVTEHFCSIKDGEFLDYMNAIFVSQVLYFLELIWR